MTPILIPLNVLRLCFVGQKKYEEESLKYDTVKLAILRAYEFVHEAYSIGRGSKNIKNSSSTFVEFAREKSALLDK